MQPPEPALPDVAARDAGATHVLELSDRMATFYRRNADGAVEFATAHRIDNEWTLTSWTLRLTHAIPTAARALRFRRAS